MQKVIWTHRSNVFYSQLSLQDEKALKYHDTVFNQHKAERGNKVMRDYYSNEFRYINAEYLISLRIRIICYDFGNLQ